MKIFSIHIKGFQQFEDLHLDFTNPENGEPVDKVCFIGRNGTGKSTLLVMLNYFMREVGFGINSKEYPSESANPLQTFVRIRIKDENQYFDMISFKIFFEDRFFEQKPICLKAMVDCEIHEKFLLDQNKSIDERKKYFDEAVLNPNKVSRMNRFKNSDSVFIYAPVEEFANREQFNQLISHDSNLNESLNLFTKFPQHHVVDNNHIRDFWTLLTFLIKKREKEQQEFENEPLNIEKRKRELLEEFDAVNPKILDKIGKLWNTILDRTGLEFDIEGAKIPVQLNENLQAFIRVKKTKEIIQYHQLSTGIRNFIFRIGHIYSLYFNREIKRGLLLVDEPENSLFPDFLFELMELYNEIIIDKNKEKNTQMFFATHSPIVAAQFQPYERIILDWNDEGHVTAKRGKSPIGDDPNDILCNDFQLDHLMGKEGQKMWEEYLNLRRELRDTSDSDEKKRLLIKINQIGQAYNFE